MVVITCFVLKCNLFFRASRLALGPTQLHIQWVLVIKPLWHGTVCSPPCSAVVKNVWSNTSAAPYALKAWCSIKQRENLSFFWIYSSDLVLLVEITLGFLRKMNREEVLEMLQTVRMYLIFVILPCFQSSVLLDLRGFYVNNSCYLEKLWYLNSNIVFILVWNRAT